MLSAAALSALPAGMPLEAPEGYALPPQWAQAGDGVLPIVPPAVGSGPWQAQSDLTVRRTTSCAIAMLTSLDPLYDVKCLSLSCWSRMHQSNMSHALITQCRRAISVSMSFDAWLQ